MHSKVVTWNVAELPAWPIEYPSKTTDSREVTKWRKRYLRPIVSKIPSSSSSIIVRLCELPPCGSGSYEWRYPWQLVLRRRGIQQHSFSPSIFVIQSIVCLRGGRDGGGLGFRRRELIEYAGAIINDDVAVVNDDVAVVNNTVVRRRKRIDDAAETGAVIADTGFVGEYQEFGGAAFRPIISRIVECFVFAMRRDSRSRFLV